MQAFCSPQPPKIIFIVLSVRFFGKTKVGLIFFAMTMCYQILSCAPICVYFCVVSRSLRAPAPWRTHTSPFYPPSPIHTTFCLTSQNMMSGEISPTIRSKNMPYITIYVYACLVCLSARTPTPYSIHPHPSSPICTYLHPPKPDIVLYVCIIYVNLNEK